MADNLFEGFKKYDKVDSTEPDPGSFSLQEVTKSGIAPEALADVTIKRNSLEKLTNESAVIEKIIDSFAEKLAAINLKKKLLRAEEN